MTVYFSLVWWSEFRITELWIIVFNIPKDLSTRTYVIALTTFFLQTDNTSDARLDPERIPGWNTYFYFTVWTPNRTILNGLTDLFGFFFVCVCLVALFDFYMTNRRQQVQIGNAISDTCSVKFVALFYI